MVKAAGKTAVGRLILAGLLLTFARSALPGAPPPEGAAQRVETGHVREQRLTSNLEAIGSLEPFQEIEISAKVQGQIVRMLVDHGQSVAQDQPLFELDSHADQIALDRARAELEKAEHELRKLESGSRPEEIEEARRRLAATEALSAAARDEWERLSRLADQGIAAASELVRVRADYDVSLAQLSQAKARLDLIEVGFRTEDIMVAQAEVKVRRAQVNDIERRLAEHRVQAPAKGVVARRLKEAGEWTGSGETALVLLVLDPMRLRIEAPQTHIPRIRPGMQAEVTIPGLEEEQLEAVVTSVIPQAQTGSRNFPVILQLANPEFKVAAGMYARVVLTIDEGRKVLTAPREAIQYRGQELVVFRVDPVGAASPAGAAENPEIDGVAHQVRVTITRELEQAVVLEALTPAELWDGCEIVTLGATRLKDGSPVQRLTVGSSPESGPSADETR